jgi:LPXTG-motif cell wall-anchored protein
VIVDDISVVIVIDYYSRPVGVLNISRFACEDPNPVGIAISVLASQPDVWTNEDCTPATGDVTIDVVSEVSAASIGTFSIEASGQVDVELDPGNYQVTDVASGLSTIVGIEGGIRVWTLIQDSVTQSGGIGEDPDGNPGGPDDPDDGTGANPDGQGGPTSGSGVGAPGDGTDTTGGIDAGSNSEFEDYDSELASVSSLPETGAGTVHTTMLWAGLAVMAFFILTMSTGVAVRRKVVISRVDD